MLKEFLSAIQTGGLPCIARATIAIRKSTMNTTNRIWAIPAEAVIDFTEADFERAAYEMHKTLGEASPANLNRMLQLHGFREE